MMPLAGHIKNLIQPSFKPRNWQNVGISQRNGTYIDAVYESVFPSESLEFHELVLTKFQKEVGNDIT